MIRHSNGGRSASNTIVPQLESGLRFGFVASSDNHRGYPGAYGEGVLGVWAKDLSRASIFEAIRARRTYAATGDRIGLEFAINDRPMGSDLPATADRQIDVRVEGQDSIAMIELVRNGRVIERHFPEDQFGGQLKLPGRAKCRLQYGWGPWAALGLGRTCMWDMTIRIEGGRFRHVIPCFQSGPYEEELRDKLRVISEHGVVSLFTAPTAFRAIKKEDPDGAFLGKYDLSAFRVLFLAGERADPDTIHWAEDKLKVPVIDHWWQTETGWTIAGNPVGLGQLPVKYGSPTVAMPGYDVQILDDAGHPVEDGTLGNIVVKLPLPPSCLPTLWGNDRRFRKVDLTGRGLHA